MTVNLTNKMFNEIQTIRATVLNARLNDTTNLIHRLNTIENAVNSIRMLVQMREEGDS